MPNRLFNGEAAWSSGSIAHLPDEIMAEYAWCHALALDDGSFECEPQQVWHKCYAGIRRRAGRPWTLAEVAEVLDEFARWKLLFRWLQVGRRALPYRVEMDGSHAGKVWGFWVNIDKPGRLPAKSDRRKVGPGVPQRMLEKFLNEREPERQMRLGGGQAKPGRSLARRQDVPGTTPGGGSPGLEGVRRGSGRGLGLGAQGTDVEKTEEGKTGEQIEVSAPPSSSPTFATPTASLTSAHPPAGRNAAKKNNAENSPKKNKLPANATREQVREFLKEQVFG